LAVLPFQNLMGDTTQGYLIDGLMEELTSELAKAGALEIRSRTSAMRYENTGLSAPEIGRELSVDGLVEGSVMSWGDTVRVVVQLVDAGRDAHRWSREYSEPYERLPTIPDRVARDLREVLLGALAADSVEAATTTTQNIVAYELYRRGRRELYRVDRPDMAIDLFEQAIAEDSSFAQAWSGLADAHISQSMFGKPRERFERAHAAVLQALRLDPDLSEARGTLGYLRGEFERDYADAERQFLRALEINPSNALAQDGYGFLLAYTGRGDQGIEHCRMAQRLNPSDPAITTDLAFLLMMVDRCSEAEREAQRAIAMDPNVENSTVALGVAMMCLGRNEEAIQALESLEDAHNEAPISKFLGYAYGKAGRRQDALRILHDQESEIGSPRGRAWVHLGLGQVDEAVEAYKEAIAEMDRMIPQDMWLWIWDDLQDHPGYQELLRLVRLDEYVVP
jgi:TolB-like protein/Tfp pilus assembly protein PilF